MAFDGIAIYNIITELEQKIIGSRVDKIYQPEHDEIILNLRNQGNNYKLLLTCNAKYPRFHLTESQKNNPANAPLFCMVLRKHLSGGKITKILQPDFDRIVNIFIESRNDFGDITEKQIIIEIMGRHSNIILIDEKNNILESAKHVPFEKSSVRQIFPGLIYKLPPNQDKLNPMKLDFDNFLEKINNSNSEKIDSIIYRSLFGISPIVAKEICYRSNIDNTSSNLSVDDAKTIFNNFSNLIENLIFKNQLIYDDFGKLIDFSFIDMKIYENNKKILFEEKSQMIEKYYKEKDLVFRTEQKTSDIKKIIDLAINRCQKKKDLFNTSLKEIENRELLKLYGELITANIYQIKKGDIELSCENFYENELPTIKIKLDPNLSPSLNAQKYFKKYSKEKRTYLALLDQIKENDEEIIYLNTILGSLKTSTEEIDIKEIRDEIFKAGYIKKKKNLLKDKKEKKSKPLHFISSDGFDIFVGKNNNQNDELTLKFAKNNDLWFHTKNIPGSHVIIKVIDKYPTENTIIEAANLAAFYSQGKDGSNVAVDYTIKKNVKKPSGAKPGMVIYENYKTVYVTPDDNIINSLKNIKI